MVVATTTLIGVLDEGGDTALRCTLSQAACWKCMFCVGASEAHLDSRPGGSFQPSVLGFSCSGIGLPASPACEVCVGLCVVSPTGMGTSAWREGSGACQSRVCSLEV